MFAHTWVVCLCRLAGLLLLHLLQVELQLLALQDVAVAATALARARGDASKQPAGSELLSQVRVQLAGLQALLQLPLDIVGHLKGLDIQSNR